MLEHLKAGLARYGILVKRCIITKVMLDEEIANSMQDKTIFQWL